MKTAEALGLTRTEEVEDWWLERLSDEALDVAPMIEVLAGVRQEGRADLADAWSEMLHEELSGRRDRAGLLKLAKWRVADEETAPPARDVGRALEPGFHDRLGRALFESAGFSEDLDARECVRRLALLCALEEGTLCADKTWGFGVVRRVDAFYRKVEIDFEDKPGHEMSLAYAAKTLELIPESHLLALKHRDPERLRTMVEETPGDVVKRALAAYGPMAAARLKEVLCEAVVEEADWKRFWDGARKALKADPLVEMPTRRNEPIRVLDTAGDVVERRLSRLESEHDPVEIIRQVKELTGDTNVPPLDDVAGGIVSDRLRFVLEAARGSRPEWTARVQRLLDGLEAEPSATWTASLPDRERMAEELLAPSSFMKACSDLSTRETEDLLEWLARGHEERVAELLLEGIDRMPSSAVGVGTEFLISRGRTESFIERAGELLGRRNPPESLLYWLCREYEQCVALDIADMPTLLMLSVESLESQVSGERLRVQKRLRALFTDRVWLGAVLGALGETERAELLKRVSRSPGWEPTERRSVMAAFIRLHPELEAVLASKGDADSTKQVRYTSWRSYHAREAELRRLVEEAIPQNSREIAVARSYGDLSENHEYKAAKEHQGILLRRRGETERDLESVQGTDFGGFPTERAGTGTRVEIVRPDGTQERYLILGEWDRDESLGIISSKSRLAELLDGAGPGDEVELPAMGKASGQEGEHCRVVSVDALPDEIVKWASG